MVELLVTIAIIAVLASLLLPALSRAKFTAKNAICVNNLRQLSLALQSYTATHERFPLYEPHMSTMSDLRDKPWWEALELPRTWEWGTNYPGAEHSQIIPIPWRRLKGVWRCPLNEGPIQILIYGYGSGQVDSEGELTRREEMQHPTDNCYGYNAWGVGQIYSGYGLGGLWPNPRERLRSTPESAVRSPSDMVALGDIFTRSVNSTRDGTMNLLGRISPVSDYNSYGNNSKNVPPKKQPAFIAHRRRANRAFVDGHIEVEDMRRNYAATDAQLQRWNNDNLPHREFLRD